MGCIGLGLYAAVRLIASRGPFPHALRCCAHGAGAMALSLAICAAQLLPFVEYMQHMALYIYRFEPDGVAHYRYSLFDLMSAWSPRLLGTELEGTFWGTTNHTYLGMLYVGAPVWICASLVLARPQMAHAIRTRIFTLLTIPLACAYLSTEFPGAGFVPGLPLIAGARPAYFLAFPTLAITLVSAHALQAWTGQFRSARGLVKPGAAALFVTLLALAGLAAAYYVSSDFSAAAHANPGLPAYIAKQCAITISFLACALIVLLMYTKFPARTRVLGCALCALLLADQSTATHGLFGTMPRKYIFPESKLTDYLRSQGKPCRIRFDTTSIPRVRTRVRNRGILRL